MLLECLCPHGITLRVLSGSLNKTQEYTFNIVRHFTLHTLHQDNFIFSVYRKLYKVRKKKLTGVEISNLFFKLLPSF